MKTIGITIGRNIGDIAMDENAWALFQSQVYQVLDILAEKHEIPGAFIESWSSTEGSWGGVPEDSCHFQLRMDKDANSQDLLDELQTRYLPVFLDLWEQEAIAVTVGRSFLVK